LTNTRLKFETYTTLAAQQMFAEASDNGERRCGLQLRGVGFRNFVLRGGFMDGYRAAL